MSSSRSESWSGGWPRITHVELPCGPPLIACLPAPACHETPHRHAASLPCLHASALGRGRDWVVGKLDFDKVSGSVSFFETVIRWVLAHEPAAACWAHGAGSLCTAGDPAPVLDPGMC